MKKKFTIASMITCLLLMATFAAFSQNNKLQKKNATPASTEAVIKSVTPNLAHHNILVTFANIDPREEYHLLLYNSEKELISSYWVDGDQMSLFVGALAPNNYELVLMRDKDNEEVDKKDILLQ